MIKNQKRIHSLMKIRIIILTIIGLTFLFAESKISHHDITYTLNPIDGSLTANDQFVVSTDDVFEFYLSNKLTVTELSIDNKVREYTILEDGDFNKYEIKRNWFGLEKKEKIISISYNGILFQDATTSTFSREKIAMEIDATISEDGIFLSPSAGYYPMADEDLLTFHSTINLPNGWSAVSEGKLLLQENGISEFKTEHLVDGMFITAAQWDVQKKIVNGVEFYTYFFPEDAELAQNYLDMSVRYVQMYSEMLSPYPFSKFAVVENFFPTGYGMPSYTVLGRSVIHLPFIVYTSLGHEVLHNWWGNSVYVGDGGNWCEGLTSYQADYLYKLQKSENDAKQYRKNLLKDYTVYATDESDFAPSEFTSRTDMSTRAIGYGKVAMIFHMIEEKLGNKRFIQALKLVIERHQWTKTGYTEFFDAFEEVGGVDFSEFKQKWIDEKGNPKLELVKNNGDFFIKQSGSIKPMWIDVEEATKQGVVNYTLFSNSELTTIQTAHPFNVQNTLKLVIDGDYHIMRNLDDREMDMTIRHLLGEPKFAFVVPEKTEEWLDLARSFNGHLNEENELAIFTQTELLPEIPLLFLGIIPNELKHLNLNGKIDIYHQVVTSNDHSLVWAFKQNNGQVGMLLYSENPKELIPLARKIPHYGKYGYLIFNNGKNVGKGNHETTESPLIWENNK